MKLELLDMSAIITYSEFRCGRNLKLEQSRLNWVYKFRFSFSLVFHPTSSSAITTTYWRVTLQTIVPLVQ